MLTFTPAQLVELHVVLTLPAVSYQSIWRFVAASCGTIFCMLASTAAAPLSQTTDTRAPQRVASLAEFQVHSIREKSRMPRNTVRKKIITSAISTAVEPRIFFMAARFRVIGDTA